MELVGSSKILAEQHQINKIDFERTCSRKVEHCTASQSPEDTRNNRYKFPEKSLQLVGKQEANCSQKRTGNRMPSVPREVQTKKPGMLIEEQKRGC